MNRIMIAGTNSGCGKTTIVCALLQALVNRGIKTAAFKCGPDYIDPLFYSRIIGAESHNLDSWFCGSDMLRFLLSRNSGEISVIESVMGFYDGVKSTASSCQTAVDTNTPVAIVIDCKGMSSSVGAVMKGFLDYRTPNNIKGFIFNRLPKSLVPEVREICRSLRTVYLGRMPYDTSVSIASRHLGLVTPDGIADIKEKIQCLAEYAEKNIDIEKLIEISSCEQYQDIVMPEIPNVCNEEPVRIGVSCDSAFCFLYEDNLDMLREMGCEIVKFSPLGDERLPDGISGLIICGGYPELYADKLSENKSMLGSVKDAILNGIPAIAECGGFMYLHRYLISENGKKFEMAGVIDANVCRTEKLQRFGYTYLTAEHDNMLCRKGEKLSAHEFHYWESTDCGSSFEAKKAGRDMTYKCVHADMNSYFGFPHLYFYGNIFAAENFVRACVGYRRKNEKDRTDRQY